MSARRIAAIGLPALLLLPGLVAAQDHGETPDTVRLAFAWGAGASADVVTERSRERSGDGSRSAGRAALRYRMALEPNGDGYIVRYSNFAGDAPAGSTPADVAAHLAAFTPTYLVNRAGEFRDLGDPEAVRALADSVLGPLMEQLAATSPGAAEFLAGLTSDEMLRSAAEQDWNMLVGTWAGAEFVIGTSYGSRIVEHFPLFGGIDLPMDYRFTALDRVPCDSTDPGLGCVALEMESRPDPAMVGRVIGEALAKLVPGEADAIAGATFDVHNTVRLIARPESLQPYRLTVRKDLTLTLPSGEGPGELRQVEMRDQVFSWR